MLLQSRQREGKPPPRGVPSRQALGYNPPHPNATKTKRGEFLA